MKKALSLMLVLALMISCPFSRMALAQEDSSSSPEEAGEQNGLKDLVGGLMGGLKEAGEQRGLIDLVGALLGGFGADMSVHEEAENTDWMSDGAISELDGTFWESGEKRMEIVFQQGNYLVTIQDGDTHLSYLCKYDEVIENDRYFGRLTGIGTGSEAGDAQQADHGKAVFIWDNWAENLAWQRENEAIIFTRIINPLDNTKWVGHGITLTLRWLGGFNYVLSMESPSFEAWNYQCVLNEEANALEGAGAKAQYNSPVYTDAQATFAFSADRTCLTWRDGKEPAAAEGLVLEAVPRDLPLSTWRNDTFALAIFDPDGFGRYSLHVFENELNEEPAETGETEEILEEPRIEYDYLCTFDWETNTFTALDPSAIDYDSLELYADPALHVSTAVFTLQDASHILWLDDSGLAGKEGMVLTRDEF